jgi:hypothetical protein
MMKISQQRAEQIIKILEQAERGEQTIGALRPRLNLTDVDPLFIMTTIHYGGNFDSSAAHD